MRKMMKFEWNPNAQEAFEKLKQQFLQKPVHQMVNQEEPFEIECDTSAFAMDAVLLQRDTNRDKYPVSYYLKALKPAEHNYHVSDQEFLAIIRALKEW
jgi:hypothetical protein